MAACQIGSQSLEPRSPKFSHLLPVGNEFGFPGAGVEVLTQRRVTLPECATESGPVLEEGWFHVEHSPVQPASAFGRRPLHQAMDLRVDDLHEERRRQFGQALDIPAVQPRGIGLVAPVLETDLVRRIFRLGEHGEMVGMPRNEAVRVPGPEGSPAAYQEGGLKNRGLAGPVGAVDEIEVGAQIQRCLLKAAELADPELGQAHVRLAGSALTGAWASRRSGRWWSPASGSGSCCWHRSGRSRRFRCRSPQAHPADR